MATSRYTAAKLGLSVVALVVVLGGCRKAEDFPIEPKLTFKSFELFGDSASLIVSFTDGDGDVGLDPSDNVAPFDTGSAYYNNFFVELFRLDNGAWTQVDFNELPMYYRIPRITPTGQNKVLEGDIALAIDRFTLFIPPGADTVRYTVRMVDRALHMSNTVTSNTIVL